MATGRCPSLVVGRSPVVSEFRESPEDFRKAVFSAHITSHFSHFLSTAGLESGVLVTCWCERNYDTITCSHSIKGRLRQMMLKGNRHKGKTIRRVPQHLLNIIIHHRSSTKPSFYTVVSFCARRFSFNLASALCFVTIRSCFTKLGNTWLPTNNQNGMSGTT